MYARNLGSQVRSQPLYTRVRAKPTTHDNHHLVVEILGVLDAHALHELLWPHPVAILYAICDASKPTVTRQASTGEQGR